MMRQRCTSHGREYNPYGGWPLLPEPCQCPVGQIDSEMGIAMYGQAHTQKDRPDEPKPRHLLGPGKAVVEPVSKKNLHDRKKAAAKQGDNGCCFDSTIDKQGQVP